MVDERVVSDCGGHRELRPVILTRVQLGDLCLAAEITLTNRDSMRFRMLLGRTAMKGRMTVNPAASYLLEKLPLMMDSKATVSVFMFNNDEFDGPKGIRLLTRRCVEYLEKEE